MWRGDGRSVSFGLSFDVAPAPSNNTRTTSTRSRRAPSESTAWWRVVKPYWLGTVTSFPFRIRALTTSTWPCHIECSVVCEKPPNVEAGASTQELFHCPEVVAGRGQVERRFTIAITGVHVCPADHKVANAHRMTLGRSNVGADRAVCFVSVTFASGRAPLSSRLSPSHRTLRQRSGAAGFASDYRAHWDQPQPT